MRGWSSRRGVLLVLLLLLHDDGVVDQVVQAVVLNRLAIVYAVRLRQRSDLGVCPSQPDHSRVEVAQILLDFRWGVAIRVNGDEHRLHLGHTLGRGLPQGVTRVQDREGEVQRGEEGGGTVIVIVSVSCDGSDAFAEGRSLRRMIAV